MTTRSMVDIQRITAEETRPLRHQVLRAHQSMRQMAYPGDDAPQTAHFGAMHEGALIAVASVYDQRPPGLIEGEGLWRIRGMAVSEAWRDKRIGSMLLEACLDHARENGARIVWCNARCSAKGFYHRHGFQPVGAEFDIMGLGPHVVMAKKVRD